MLAVREEEGAVGEVVVALQLFQVAAQFGGGGGFWGVFVGTGGVPDEFAESEGDFTFAGFGGEELGEVDGDMIPQTLEVDNNNNFSTSDHFCYI